MDTGLFTAKLSYLQSPGALLPEFAQPVSSWLRVRHSRDTWGQDPPGKHMGHVRSL